MLAIRTALGPWRAARQADETGTAQNREMRGLISARKPPNLTDGGIMNPLAFVANHGRDGSRLIETPLHHDE